MPSKPKGGGSIPQVKFSLNISESDIDKQISILKDRFQKSLNKQLVWEDFEKKLRQNVQKISSISAMEQTGGEPEVLLQDKETSEYLVFDASTESPLGRRSICYDDKGVAERNKKNIFPGGSATGLAAAMGVELLDEERYKLLQNIKPVDLKSQSWLLTPDSIYQKGGGIFGDRRYDHVFIYHNSTPSFYSARGFRGLIRV